MTTPYNACVDLLDANVDRGRADHPAVVSRARTVTYGELLGEVCRVAAGLRAIGVQPEQRVAMVMLDSVDFYATFLGALRIGAIPAPVNPLLPGRDLGAVVSVSRARVLVVSTERSSEIEAIRDAAPELTDVVTAGSADWETLLDAGHGRSDIPYATWEESPGFWLCTSGSTGRPKLAMHRQIDLRRTADTYARAVLGVQADDRCYSVGPMFHAYGLGNSLTFPFSVGATAIVESTRPPNPALVGGVVDDFEPTLFFCIPTFYAALAASNLSPDTFSSVRHAVSAAEPLPADTYHRFADRFGVQILDGIGSTEMTHIYVSNAPGAIRPGTSGRPVPGYDVAIVDDDGRPVAGDAAGHLEVRGPSMAVGYWCDQAATQRSFYGDRMRTGDMYARSGDGYYTYLGRSDDMLRVGGEWVSPAEVEAVLISHAAVLEAAVVGQRDDNDVQRPVAFVVPAPDAVVDLAELEALCKAELAGFKRPKRYQLVAELPKTATGKIQRFKLRAG
ncbi:MAG TPA: benzoate-CoA ligase family protein [Ilumatobacter sp.]|jgi:benzoate-CoA ligase family protein|nr:benzoate-CoA ligase family protein [Ilumatobacter sp.]